MQGHVYDNVEKYDSTIKYLEPPLLALSHEGRFERTNAGTSEALAGRGAAFGDLNNDGWMDVVTTRLQGTPLVFLNRGGKEHWISIVLQGTKSNRDGYGARVEVNGQVRFATASGSYLSSSDPRLHFGLGAGTTATIEVRWPSGLRQKVIADHVDQYLVIKEQATR